MTTVPYRCTNCGETEHRTKIPAGHGTDDDSARHAGWRIGTTQGGKRQRICPECSGIDENYWLDRWIPVGLDTFGGFA